MQTRGEHAESTLKVSANCPECFYPLIISIGPVGQHSGGANIEGAGKKLVEPG